MISVFIKVYQNGIIDSWIIETLAFGSDLCICNRNDRLITPCSLEFSEKGLQAKLLIKLLNSI